MLPSSKSKIYSLLLFVLTFFFMLVCTTVFWWILVQDSFFSLQSAIVAIKIVLNSPKIYKSFFLAAFLPALCITVLVWCMPKFFFSQRFSIAILALSISVILVLFNHAPPISRSLFYTNAPSGEKGYHDKLIAHAAGSVQGEPPVNSEEQLRATLSRGKSFVELDVLESKDGILLCAHDWRQVNELLGKGNGSEPLSADEFLTGKLLDVHTPMTLDKAFQYMRSQKNLTLVLDKTDQYAKVMQIIKDPEKVIVEVFNKKQISSAKSAGLRHIAYSVWNLKQLPFVLKGKVNMITAPFELVQSHPEIFKHLHAMGFTIMAFTSNNQQDALENIGVTISLLYTDFL